MAGDPGENVLAMAAKRHGPAEALPAGRGISRELVVDVTFPLSTAVAPTDVLICNW